jgi:hypothetical protein
MPMNPRLLRPIASRLALPSDADARAYVLAVNSADGQPLEKPVVEAIGAFVEGCKADGIWSAIKASCILMGARTLSGALTPLVGSAPTNNGPFVSGDYGRKTGLVGNGSTKYLNSNRAVNADPQNNQHAAVYVQTLPGAIDNAFLAGGTGSGRTNLARGSTGSLFTASQAQIGTTTAMASAGFVGVSRSVSGSYERRVGGATDTVARDSQTPFSGSFMVLGRNTASGVDQFSDARLAFYSIGESLNLALLDTRVTNLYNAIGAAIP